MFTTIKDFINKEEIEYFTSTYNYVFKEENISLEEVYKLLCDISYWGGWEIASILSNTIQEIKNAQVRNEFRRFLISERFGIYMYYQPDQYCIMYAWDDCVLVNSPGIIKDSTILLSSKGDIIIPEGQVWLNENFGRYGFTAKWNGLLGIYSKKGQVFLPCIFDECENDYLPKGNLRYKGEEYMYHVYGEDTDDLAGQRKWEDLSTEEKSQSVGIHFFFENRVYEILYFYDYPSAHKTRDDMVELFDIISSLHPTWSDFEI